MYARSTTIQADPASVDAGVANVREEILPALQGIDGFVGLSMLVDRSTGRCIVTTSWRDQEALAASAEPVRPLREKAAGILGGTPEVAQWEIAVMHRDHPSHEGACARSTWVRAEPARIQEAVETFRLAALPRIEEMPGFCSASFLVDRATGRAVSTTCFADRATLDASREQVDRIRTAATHEAGVTVLEVAEFDLPVAHLRVPELA